MVKLVNTADLKSAAVRLPGSSPGVPTTLPHYAHSDQSEHVCGHAAEGIALPVFAIILSHRCGPVQFTSNCRSPIIR